MSTDDSIHGDRAPIVSAHSPNVRTSVVRGPGAGQSILLRRAVSIIGSGRICKVRLKHGDVSNVHCVIVNTGEQVYLRDLVSHNGTFLNDLRAEHERLEDDDVIKIDPWQLRITVLAPAAGDMGDFTGLGLEPSPSAIALEDSRSGEMLKLPREVNLLGRRPDCDYFIEDRSVSRAHAVVFNYLSRVVVFDLASRNGIKVNGKPISFSTLKSDDLLTIGSVELRVKLVDPMVRVKSSGNGQAVQAPHPEGTFSDRIDLGSAEPDRHQHPS